MHQPKPKSAPPRLKSKFVKNRTNAMKEIEAWIRKDGEPFPVPEASRMSGQLTDNVTEERMLKAKLWELSKERYKFLSQNSYEQKVFSDRQQRKAGLRRVASASWDSRSRLGSTGGTPLGIADSNDDTLPGRHDLSRHSSLAVEGNNGDATPVPRRAKPKNARFSLLDRLDPTKKRPPRSKSSDAKLPSDNAEDSGSVSITKTIGDSHVVSSDRLSKNSKIPLKKTESEASLLTSHPDIKLKQNATAPLKPSGIKTLSREFSASRLNQHERKEKQTPEEDTGGAVGRAKAPSAPHPSHRVDTPPVPSSSNPNKPPQHHQHPHNRISALRQQLATTPISPDPTDANNTPSGGAASGVNSRVASATSRSDHPTVSRFGTPAAESMTQDPRYARLERTLCPLVRSKTTGDIGTIVNQIEALHVRPKKRPPDAKKTKIELKAFEYMKDKGFVF